jgi:hypothetical protein
VIVEVGSPGHEEKHRTCREAGIALHCRRAVGFGW